MLFVCVLQQDELIQPISLKLAVMHTNGKNRITFGGDPEYDILEIFISIPHTVTGRFSRKSTKRLILTCDESTIFMSDSKPDHSGNLDSNTGSLLVEATRVRGVHFKARL